MTNENKVLEGQEFLEFDVEFDSESQFSDIDIEAPDTEIEQEVIEKRRSFSSGVTKRATATVLEVKEDTDAKRIKRNKGKTCYVAKVSVNSGSLLVGDTWTVGATKGLVAAITNEEGKSVNYADAPATVEMAGLTVEPLQGLGLYTEPTPKTHMGQRAKNRISNTVIYIVLSIMAVVWLLPFFGILLESFRVESTGHAGYIIPKQWGFDNYVRLFTDSAISFPKWFLNTLIMGLVTAVVQTVFILAVSYALSRNRFKGRRFLMNVMLVFGMFPGFLTLILLYNLMNDWNMTGANAPWGLIIIYVASSGMGYHICKGFFDTISHSLDEAARVDGATGFQIFYKIILPLSKPIIIYTILMGFMAPWGDFVMARYMANNSHDGYNVAAGLQWMLTDSMEDKYYTTFCAGGVVVALPITILFMCLQKYYVAGVTGGAVKG